MRPLAPWRRCAASVVVGYSSSARKLNNGVLLATRGSRFLRAWREGYRDYRPQLWDYNSCNVSTALAQRAAAGSAGGLGSTLIHLAPELAPLPRYRAAADYRRHLSGEAPVVHLTGFAKKWRFQSVMGHRLLSLIAQPTLRAAAARANASTPLQRICVAKLAAACWARGARCG